MKMKFTITNIEALKTTDKVQFITDENTIGLSLRIFPSGVKSYYFDYRMAGGRSQARKHMALGNVAKITLAQAKSRVKQLQGMIVSGIDPSQKIKDDAKAEAQKKTALTYFSTIV